MVTPQLQVTNCRNFKFADYNFLISLSDLVAGQHIMGLGMSLPTMDINAESKKTNFS